MMSPDLRVLLAEDEEMHSFPLEVALRRAGFHVDVARDYDGVLEKGMSADALVIDARLPSEALEGIHAAARLVHDGLEDRVPIIFISVYPEKTDKVQQTLHGLPALSNRYRWLEKAFEPYNLVKMVREAIQMSGRGSSSGQSDDE